MGNPFKKARPGDRLSIPATTWNKLVDVAKAADQDRLSALVRSLMSNADRDIIKIKNNSGADVDRFAVLGLSGPLFLPTDNETAFKNREALEAVKPDILVHKGKFVICLEPIADGAYGRAQVSGIAITKVKIVNDGSFAEIEDKETKLAIDGEKGSAAVLWKETSSGDDVWAIVKLSGQDCSSGCPESLACVTDITSIPNYDGTKKQGLIHSTSGCLEWMNIGECS